ncbi:MAG TPA: ROK family glucokinase [Streptosporangiaceae bacterium]|nr:ROK family glucokinase [Streptosporangiaceae bacterium]
MKLTIGVDVGGTKAAAGVVDAEGHLVEKLKRSTPAASPARTAEVIADIVTELASRHPVSAVGLGAAGFIDETRSTVLFAPNLAWRNEPLRQSVEDRVGLPVIVENDADSGLWAEAQFGAARGYRDVIMIAVGTGIGAAILINGDLYHGRFGIAGEPGHYRVVPDGRLCGCGNRGCWEQYSSGSALVAEAREFARRSPEGAMRLLQLGGGHPEGISGPQVTEAAREGDPAALRCFQIVGGWLGQGMADLAAILDPGCFIIGGGVSEAGELLLDPARAAYERALVGRGYRPLADVRLAELGADAGVVGAADLARRFAEVALARPDSARSDSAQPDRAQPFSRHTTAPSSGPSPSRGSSPIRMTSTANPPTNAPMAKNAATAGTVQPTAVAISR